MKKQNGQAMVEYVFIIAFVIFVVIIFIAVFGDVLSKWFNEILDLL